MTTYVPVHWAWHGGSLLEDVAEAIRAHRHDVHGSAPVRCEVCFSDPKAVGEKIVFAGRD